MKEADIKRDGKPVPLYTDPVTGKAQEWVKVPKGVKEGPIDYDKATRERRRVPEDRS